MRDAQGHLTFHPTDMASLYSKVDSAQQMTTQAIDIIDAVNKQSGEAFLLGLDAKKASDCLI